MRVEEVFGKKRFGKSIFNDMFSNINPEFIKRNMNSFSKDFEIMSFSIFLGFFKLLESSLNL